MPVVSVEIRSIEPGPGRVHQVTYEYAVTSSPEERGRKATFEAEIRLFGVDRWADDKLAVGIDRHVIPRSGNGRVEATRSFPVATDLLNEDLGQDEIRIEMCLRDTGTQAVEVASSGVFIGRF